MQPHGLCPSRVESPPRPLLEIAEIFREHGPRFRQTHALTAEQRKVMWAIENCRTAVLGGHLDVCNACGYAAPSFNSCRNRHCPKCQSLAHICVDTGMGRVGAPYREAAPLVRDLASRSSIDIEGIMMTFAEVAEFDTVQHRRFRELCGSLKSEGARLGRMHAASSFGLFENSDSFLDMVRPGMAIFGVYSEAHFREMGLVDLRPAMALRARVIYVKKLSKGDSVGYGRAFKAEHDVWVATLPVGHVDGWPRAAAKGASVRIGGKHYPVIGAVSASHTIVELGAEPSVSIGDVATFFDSETGSRPEDVAAATGTSVYNRHAPQPAPSQADGRIGYVRVCQGVSRHRA